MAKNIFVSFAFEDYNKVDAFKKAIKKKLGDNYDVIVISDKREPGKPLTDKVIAGLKDSNYFIPILTKHSIKNQWVNQEIGYAKALDRIIVLPIVGNNIIDKLKGFIHKQLDLSFNFDSFPSNPSKEASSYKKCYSEIINHLSDLILMDSMYEVDKVIDTTGLKNIMDEIYKKYKLDYTELLNPKVENTHTRTHSHTENGYFNYLINHSYSNYSFKYYNSKHHDRYLTINVNNEKPIVKLKLHLTAKENAEIKFKIGQMLGEIDKRKSVTREFLAQPIDYATLLAYAKRKYPHLPVDEKINNLLLKDLDKDKYKILEDIDQIVEKAKPAVEEYRLENPDWFKSGTDYLTKAMGFVDKEFRKKHPFGEKTKITFEKYSKLIT